jgi:hypothetical protein
MEGSVHSVGEVRVVVVDTELLHLAYKHTTLDSPHLTHTRTTLSGRMSAAKKAKTMNQLDALKEFTTVVADTGDIESINQYKPQDATTNPSLIFQAAQMPQYQGLVDDAVAYGKDAADVSDDERLALVMDKLSVNFGIEILKTVPGCVNTNRCMQSRRQSKDLTLVAFI